MNYIRKIANYLVYGYKCSGKLYLNHLRKIGMRIGEGTIFFNPKTVLIDESDPFMIKIGKNVQITGGVTILSHDYGWSVTKVVYGDILGSVRPVMIGNNVYIGMNSMILAGAIIGDNVVIGANSVVTNIIPDNCVAVGNPCKMIYTLEEYHKRREKAQLNEAIQIIKNYKACYGIFPNKDILSDHFWLFANDRNECTEKFVEQNNLMPGSEETTWSNFETHTPMFNSYDEFLQYVMGNEN